jgi:hypothetical protein
MAPIGVARGGVFFCFFVAHSSRLAPSRDARRRCGDDIPKGISSFRVRAREDFESSFVASRLARPLSRARHV